MKILDTDTCVGLLRGQPGVAERRAAEPEEEVVTTWVTAAELFFGAARSTDPAGNAITVLRFLGTLETLAPNIASARIFGEVKSRLRAEGRIVPDADLWIASIALARAAAVVTGNRRHFDRIPGVRTEDWLRGG